MDCILTFFQPSQCPRSLSNAYVAIETKIAEITAYVEKWLQFQSLYRINSLCLWCCLAWVATILMFWYVTSFNVRKGFLPAPNWLRGFFGEFTWVLPVLHIGIIGMMVLTRWWDFWTS